jgi:hypothetical protein
MARSLIVQKLKSLFARFLFFATPEAINQMKSYEKNDYNDLPDDMACALLRRH